MTIKEHTNSSLWYKSKITAVVVSCRLSSVSIPLEQSKTYVFLCRDHRLSHLNAAARKESQRIIRAEIAALYK